MLLPSLACPALFEKSTGVGPAKDGGELLDLPKRRDNVRR